MLDVEIKKVSRRARHRARPNFLETGGSRADSDMKKVTAKAKTSKSKGSSGRGSRKPVAFETVRKRIDTLVGNRAVGVVENALDEADKGHFPAMKYLFEMVGLYPATKREETPGEESLARTLLERLELPEEVGGKKDKNGVEATARPTDAVK